MKRTALMLFAFTVPAATAFFAPAAARRGLASHGVAASRLQPRHVCMGDDLSKELAQFTNSQGAGARIRQSGPVRRLVGGVTDFFGEAYRVLYSFFAVILSFPRRLGPKTKTAVLMGAMYGLQLMLPTSIPRIARQLPLILVVLWRVAVSKRVAG